MSTNRDKKEHARLAIQALQKIGHQFLDREGDLPARDQPPQALVARLGIELGRDGTPFEAVVESLGRIMDATPSSSSPRFFNQLFGGREPVATLAEMLIPLADTSMYTYKVAGAQVLVEREVLAKLLASVPYPDGDGTFSPGGSLANMTAMLIARNQALDCVRDIGFNGQRLTAYTSTDAHYSIRKAAGILGLGRSSVRDVPTDPTGSMRPGELEKLIDRDLEAGHQPFFVNATAGTTVLGAIDPIRSIAAVARAHKLWLHVDGALGASVLLSSRYRSLLAGIEQSDSLAWNAHKMMGVPLACSVLLLRQQGLLARDLGESANYLFQADEADLNPGTKSLQCGRRGDALKLWALWKHLGAAGLDHRMTSSLDLARTAADLIRDDPELELVTEPQTVNVCFRVKDTDSPALCEFLDLHGMLKIGHGAINRLNAIRLVCVNPDLDEERLVDVLDTIKDGARRLRQSLA
jgi:glutamate/tyrosine decarboxylase-like PLP-dependent enzyme